MEEWGKVILRAAVILLVLFYFCWPVRLSGSSMEPALGTMAGMYDRGDIVVFRYDGGNEPKTLVKRVAGLPGEHIRILPEGAGVEIDGEILQEPYAEGRTDGLVDMDIPEGAVFLMGDNRETSYDSRNIGAVAERDLKGKVFFRIYPFSGFGGVS